MNLRIQFMAPALLLAFLLLGWGPAALAQSETPSRNVDDLLSGFDEGGGGDSGGKESGAGDDLLSGFEEERPVAGGEDGESYEGPSIWKLGGFLRWDSSYNYAHEEPKYPGQTDYRGLSKFRFTVRLDLSITPSDTWEFFTSGQYFYDYAYEINGREDYPRTVLDQYEEEGELREAFVRVTPISSLDIRVGRQIVAWGKSDNIQVVDIINPLDFREPGLTDIADLRLPIAMTRVDYYLGAWGMTAIAIHEVRFTKYPALGSDYNPAPMALPEEVPEDGGENTQYAFALNGIFSGWDMGFYWAQVFSDETHVENFSKTPIPDFRLVHSEITMGGLAVNVALGDFLLKGEAAQFTGYRFANVPDREFTRNDTLAGLEYSGITNVTLSLEGVNRHWAGFDKRLELAPDQAAENVNQYVFTYRGSYLRETLDLVAVLSYFGEKAEQGSLQRYSATYELAEALDLTGGVVIYTPGDGGNYLLTAAQDNDRVFMDLKWSF